MRFSEWLLADLKVPATRSKPEATNSWWRVMCLTGVDYFSTLGYQPGIAFLAAGVLSPFATLVLVLVTLFAALPVYRRVAHASPNGQGSIAMLQNFLPNWYGKLFVLALLGFATTDFIITITLSAADAAAHLVHNPLVPAWVSSQMAVTLLILLLLSSIFLRGFKEAVGIAVWLVAIYLGLNLVVTTVAVFEVFRHPEVVHHWRQAIHHTGHSTWGILGVSLLLFPHLALGLSGFETGVAVMPLIQAKSEEERIRNTRWLLATAAFIMSFFLIATSLVTTMLIPASAFREGGEANGRAMAWLAHHYLGSILGSVYDISTISILAFAGASAMAGLLNLIPRYLPGFGMAPEWARASRPLVLVFTAISLFVTYTFHADVDAQGGAYATGVLVLITSASVAVMLEAKRWKMRALFTCTTAIFTYTTIANIFERPEGIKISSIFIVCIIATSLLSRAWRSTELRISEVIFDDSAKEILAEDDDLLIRVIARAPEAMETVEHLDESDSKLRKYHHLDPNECVYFFEVLRQDASNFSNTLHVSGRRLGSHRILYACSPSVPNAIAALLLALRDRTGVVPHAYFRWTEINPILNIFRFLFLGEGDTAPVTQEILRKAVKDPEMRPIVHVS